MIQSLYLNGYEPDLHHETAVAFCIHAGKDELTSPVHQHRKGQLILALRGAITCTVENALWMVPPQYAVWIPGGVEHSNQVTANAELCFLFIESSAVIMPTKCCTLKIAPLCRELILTLAKRTAAQRAEPMTRRLIQVLFDELPQQPQQQLQLPVSSHPKIRVMVENDASIPVASTYEVQDVTPLPSAEETAEKPMVTPPAQPVAIPATEPEQKPKVPDTFISPEDDEDDEEDSDAE